MTKVITVGCLVALVVSTVPGQDAGTSGKLLAYTQGGSVWTVRGVGDAPRRLVSDLTYDRPITWSPDGRFLLYWKHGDVGWDVWRVELKSGKTKALTVTTSGGCRMPRYAPDGSMIAFLRDSPEGLHVMDADGSNPRRLSPRGHRDDPPSWSPDGRRLVYSELEAVGERRLGRSWMVDLEGGENVRLFPTFHTASNPTFSSNGRLAFLGREAPGTADIYLARGDGTKPENLTETPAEEESAPLWSPDGQHIAFGVSMKKGSHLRVVEVKGRKPRTLSVGRHILDLSWSADSRSLACVLSTEKGPQIFCGGISGEELRQITTTGAFTCAWQP